MPEMKTSGGIDNKTYCDTLSNGLTVVTIEMPHLHTVEIAMFVRSGVRFENQQNNGISHFLEHMMFRGNRKYPDSVSLNREFEKIGRGLRASTNSDYTHFNFNPHRIQLEKAMELFAEFFTEPLFPSLEVEREIILEECLEDLNAEGVNVDIDFQACKLLYEGDPLEFPIIGTETSIRSIDENMLREFFQKYYCPGNMILGGAGAISHERFMEYAKTYFEPLPQNGTVVPPNYFDHSLKENQSQPQLLIQEHDDSQAELQICFRAVSYNHPDYYAVCLISRIFDDGVGSRLQKALREDRGLVYSVQARETSLSDCGTFDFDITARTEKILEISAIIFDEIKLFLRDGPTLDELEHVKKRYGYDLEQDLDSPYKQLVRYAWSRLYSTELTVEEEWELVQNISLSDIRRVAASLFVPEKLNVVLVGPHDDDLKEQLKSLMQQF